MNSNNLSWVNNRVFGGSGAPPDKKDSGAYQAPVYTDAAMQKHADIPYSATVHHGLSPEEYRKNPADLSGSAGMMPHQDDSTAQQLNTAGSDLGTQWTLTRDLSYDQNPFFAEGPPTMMSPGYTPAYLKSIIGKMVRAEFNIGSNLYMDKSGILREVGINYFVLEDSITHALTMCDLYSLKFITSPPD